ncbi:hypothetical protein HO133_003716 [Letharia lupina]|uniref:Nucleoporin Nup54 alpha-helical domain-containing protein n=1 Tax=Letharia lupina TaxID=560253 RepID=A0A8H6F9F2_9LECA|nr:uncharacterized protein HO133_003716 [Letharia lupina]KAF6219891.1 hypothetical protein HO133_003716 [Letharia lupina]
MSSLFGQPTSSLFGNNNQQQQNTSKPSPFGSLNTSTTSQPQQGGGLFSSTSTSQPQQGGGLFGSTAASQPQQGGLFGSLNTSAPISQEQQGSGLFGRITAPQQTGGGLFGSTQPQQQGGLFGSTQQPQQQQQQQGGLFQSQQQQPQQGGGLFGGSGATTNQQPQPQNQQQQGSSLFGNVGQPAPQQQQNQQPGSVFVQSQGSIFQNENAPRQKPVLAQIDLAFSKWNPQNPATPFQTYLYNTVPPEQAPFYGPTAQDDETKWEEALNKKPGPGAIPVLVKGFREIGMRMNMQLQALHTLGGRLHEINSGLSKLLQKHELSISVRAAECRRKHLRLSHQCLGLAAKTQVLRNRGYAMDGPEEELRNKFLLLERSVLDPALNGRSEEIWARMVSVRERGRLLQREFEKAGRSLSQEEGQVVDEEVMRRVKKILEDYSSQLGGLTKELAQLQNHWAEWEQSKPLAITNGVGR